MDSSTIYYFINKNKINFDEFYNLEQTAFLESRLKEYKLFKVWKYGIDNFIFASLN